ncbi:MAG: CoA transferase [Proteobacteria bacterium]|nr:CoA transferase [Pseudomonadota bacterium]
MKRRTVVSLEQALSLPSCTLRFVQLGWRVIRIEATPAGGPDPAGDPNRYVGGEVAGPDRRSYYLAPNVGKEAIALNLQTAEGHAVLHKIIADLEVDVFCCNTLPVRYAKLGIDYDTLRAVNPDIIWAGISAMGPDFPDTPGYDPMVQARVGLMDLTGAAGGPPNLIGIPLVDLKAGDEAYSSVMRALLERAETGRGQRIDISMFQAAASWLIAQMPLVDLGDDPWLYRRNGNAERNFVPSSTYSASDGYVFIVIGNDSQWRRFVEIPKFAAVANDLRATVEGRKQDRVALWHEIGEITPNHTVAELVEDLKRAKLVHAIIRDIREVHSWEYIRARMTRTQLPDGTVVGMQPKAVNLPGTASTFPLAPHYAEHTRAVLGEVGYAAAACDALEAAGVIALR